MHKTVYNWIQLTFCLFVGWYVCILQNFAGLLPKYVLAFSQSFIVQRNDVTPRRPN